MVKLQFNNKLQEKLKQRGLLLTGIAGSTQNVSRGHMGRSRQNENREKGRLGGLAG